jgi:glyoxylase-like metal-dependent hydrolase (beta-lactamase superfamily II)
MSLRVEKFTASEIGAWSNSYLITGEKEAVLFDIFMLRDDAAALAEKIKGSGKTLSRLFVSHAHPDHFMGAEVIADLFPGVQVISTPATVADIEQDGPWMLDLLQKKLGANGPGRLVIPSPMTGGSMTLEGETLEIVEFPEGESKHVSTIYIPGTKSLLTADLLYHDTHCYLTEKRPEAWLQRLDDLHAFCRGKVSTAYPGHGEPGDPIVLIEHTRAYLREFLAALPLGNAKAMEERMLARFPNHHARQFLTMFTIPAYFAPTEQPVKSGGKQQ